MKRSKMTINRLRIRIAGAARWLAAGTALVAVFGPGTAVAEEALRGDLMIHDPSTIIADDGRYWVFGTGRGILSRFSTNLVEWQAGPPVFESAPAWTTDVVPGNRGRFWAPDVLKVNGRYLLYYSVSSWGSRNSAIGLATNATLNPAAPDFRWHDAGPVIRTTERDDFNAIDPSVMQDSRRRLWLAFGSFWSGIKLIELDPKTGLRLDPGAPIRALAWHDSIEAACLHEHGGWFYLFVNWGLCCRGTNSTYNIRVGRSASVTGPYLDKNGVDLLRGGGSLFLPTTGNQFGPGHAGILERDGTNWFSYHYYDGRSGGMARLGIRPLTWTTNGWPEIQMPPD